MVDEYKIKRCIEIATLVEENLDSDVKRIALINISAYHSDKKDKEEKKLYSK